eukprot:GHVU01060997.1.p1 GENE.GHVU01060997.1~~GHVU01060997.1.p1  ORF type:complete len:294 (+),score=29.89 GHVU01060997.1:449-1330(+)
MGVPLSPQRMMELMEEEAVAQERGHRRETGSAPPRGSGEDTIRLPSPPPDDHLAHRQQQPTTTSTFFGRGRSVQTLMASGAFSGFAATVALQPLDVIRTRQQETVRGARIGALRVTTEILSRDGPMGLWRGVLVSSIRVVPGAGLYFFSASILADSYGWLERRRVLRTKPSSGLDDSSPAPSRAANTPPLWYTAFVGAAARSFAGFVVSPATVVKTRMESAQYGSQVGPRGLVVHCRELMHTEGFRGFYKGLLPTLARDVPYSGLSFALYTRFRDTAAATVGSPRVPPPLARG